LLSAVARAGGKLAQVESEGAPLLETDSR
jgi:hypothetical protein